MKRNIALVDKYPNGYRDKIAYHREQGNDEKVKYFEEKQRQLNENNCIQVLEFMGYENRGKYGTQTLVQKGKYNVTIFLSVALNELNYLEVLISLSGRIYAQEIEYIEMQEKIPEKDMKKTLWSILLRTDNPHPQLNRLLHNIIDMSKQDFVDEVCRIINSEKLMQ